MTRASCIWVSDRTYVAIENMIHRNDSHISSRLHFTVASSPLLCKLAQRIMLYVIKLTAIQYVMGIFGTVASILHH